VLVGVGIAYTWSLPAAGLLGTGMLLVVALVLGVLVVAQLRAQQVAPGIASMSANNLTLLVANLNSGNEGLRREVATLERDLNSLTGDQARGETSVDQIRRDLDRIRSWRAICPDIALRSTFIVGFPGETEAEFEELIAFLDEAQLDRAGCFAYSPVNGAAANELPGAVPEEVKEARRARFMQAQERISARRLQEKIGTMLTVLVDEVRDDEAVARSNADAPEIDGQVFIARPRNLKPGDFATVRVTRAGTHDLWAVPA